MRVNDGHAGRGFGRLAQSGAKPDIGRLCQRLARNGNAGTLGFAQRAASGTACTARIQLAVRAKALIVTHVSGRY